MASLICLDGHGSKHARRIDIKATFFEAFPPRILPRILGQAMGEVQRDSPRFYEIL